MNFFFCGNELKNSCFQDFKFNRLLRSFPRKYITFNRYLKGNLKKTISGIPNFN